jgi:SAM-dependent methyltransferase
VTPRGDRPRLELARLRTRLAYVARTGIRRRLRDLALREGADDRFVAREDLARRYLRGDGIEIGPLAFPLRVPGNVRVRYVDRFDRRRLIDDNRDMLAAAGIDPEGIPATDVIDDGAALSTFADASLDFVIANHVLEHIEDPIATLGHWLRMLRPGGVLFLTLPDARHTFDAGRPRTTVEHVVRDHREGPDVSRREHYEEWARFNEGLSSEEQVAARIEQFAATDARHHFHVWELPGFLELLSSVPLPADLLVAQLCGEEFSVILRRI